VRLAADEEHVHLEVEDDGCGLPDNGDGRRAGVGLIGIRERVRALGGTMTLASTAGVQLSVHIPLETAALAREATG
jgi:two-component system sensor histidine kinase UhpB